MIAFVGKNDSGKSTILEALDIFFNNNKGTVKIDKEDLNVTSRNSDDEDVVMTAYFTDFPESIVIDSTNSSPRKS